LHTPSSSLSHPTNSRTRPRSLRSRADDDDQNKTKQNKDSIKHTHTHNTHVNSIQNLRGALETLEKQEKYASKLKDEALKSAKEKMRAKDKRGAVAYMQRVKMYEKRVDGIWGKKNNVETQIMALESAASNKDVLAAMKQGKVALGAAVTESDVGTDCTDDCVLYVFTCVLKWMRYPICTRSNTRQRTHTHAHTDNVGEFMDDLNEQIALVDEFDSQITAPIGQQMDEDDLLAELDDLDDMLDEPEINIVEAPSPTIDLSGAVAAPTRKLPSTAGMTDQQKKEEAEMRELEAMMM
jgi:hypothetical protein